jgi:hypothetical protein
MKKTMIAMMLLVIPGMAYCQVADGEKQLKTQSADTTLGWKKGGIININTAQTSLTNWAAGGQSSVAINGLLNLYAHRKKAKSLWENYLDLAYGSLKQKKTDWWKSDDRIEFTSKYGLKASDQIYYAGLVNFRSQFSNGYNYPNDSVKISGFMSPGYLLIALGIDWVPAKDFTVFFAPATAKMTFVTDDTLASQGAFGVDPGDNVKAEFGGYLRAAGKVDLMENISLQSKIDLYTNYLENFGVIDVSWETLLSMKVNKYFSATVSTHLIYDQDVTIMKENDEGDMIPYNSKVQFKEVLAIGFSMKF